MINVTVPDGTKGDWSVETFEVSEQESSFTRIRSFQHPEEYVPAGKYKRLMRGRTVVMSNTPMEYRTNSPIIHRAKGTVLLNGLGLGMVLTAILEKKEVECVIVVEIDPDVIDLVGTHFADNLKCAFVCEDAFAYTPPKGQRYDAVWHDIWTDICGNNLTEMTRLKRKYGKRCDWQGCWSEGMCKRHTNPLLFA